MASESQLRLATRLRELREEHWTDKHLTQAELATVLGDGKSLASATVSSWENQASPKLPPAERLQAYSRFFSTRRSLEGGTPHLVPVDDLSEGEAAAFHALEAELMALRVSAANPMAKVELPAQKSWCFSDRAPINIVCALLPAKETGPLADPDSPNFTELQSFADLDSLVELHGHLCRENPDTQVYFKASPRVEPDDLSSHVILLGGIGYNEITDELSERTVLPVRQVKDPEIQTGEIFVVTIDGKEQKFLPNWRDKAHTKLREDVGLLARTSNPLNSNNTLTICNGVHSRGVLGAVRSLTDASLRDSNEEYIAQNFDDASAFAILMRVPVIGGKTMTPDFRTPGCVLYRWPGETGE
jgi:transcriptional regulator with XRE-family HTH domain